MREKRRSRRKGVSGDSGRDGSSEFVRGIKEEE